MINLLPKEYKISIKKDYLGRLAVVAGLMFVSVCFIGTVLLAPTLFLFLNNKKNINNQLSSYSKKISNLALSQEMEAEIKKINWQVDFINNANNSAKPSFYLQDFMKLKPTGIKIEGINYSNQKNKDIEEKKIVVHGQAGKRDDFLNFLSETNKKYGPKNVSSPVSNIISEKDINFTMTVSL